MSEQEVTQNNELQEDIQNIESQEVVQNEKPKAKKRIGIDKIILVVSLIGFVTVSFLWAKEKGFFENMSGGILSNKNPVKLDLYVMSQCPYGVQAEDSLEGVVKKLGNGIDLNINYIADEDGNGGFLSLHGEPEVKGNIVQLCAKKYDEKKYFDMILCQNKDYSNVATNWESCAQEVKLSNIDKVKACFEGEEGKTLLSENIKLAQAISVSGSPTYYINDKQYEGARDEGSIIKAVCNINSKLAACKNLPICFSDADCSDNIAKIGKCINAGEKTSKCEYSDPKIVNLTVLNDSRCEDCGYIEPQITDSLRQIFKGLQIKAVDYSSEDGKKLVSDIPGIKLPAYLFAANVSEGEGYPNVQPYLSEAAGYKLLAVGSEFDPTKEICNNKIDDNGNGKIDCADLECSGSLSCRKEITKRLDVFVMSDCPYGNMAELAAAEVVKNFGKNISFHVNYIASKNNDGTFNSLHGEYEVKQNKVELCVNKYYPLKNLEFINCMNEKGISDTDWKECATPFGFNTNRIETCANGIEGSNLLEQNIKIAESLNIGASPTWIINNKYQGSGLDAESIKQLFCQYNPGTAGCDNVLSSDANAAAAADAGAGCE